MELTNSLFREDGSMWQGDMAAMPPDLQDFIAPPEGHYDPMYAQGPPSVHSGHAGPNYQGKDCLRVWFTNEIHETKERELVDY